MKFSDLDKTMRQYEEALDINIIPNLPIVVRLDGRGFSTLTKDLKFKKPFDNNFKTYMIEVVKTLMKDVGFNFVYGYTQSDEISLLLHREDNTFNRKLRKLNSILASEASSQMSLILNQRATFDCRVIQLPNLELIQDYFSWRQEDAHRNSINAYTFWTLVDEGNTPRKATSLLNKTSKRTKLEILNNRGVDFNSTPTWHRRGIGIYYDEVLKEGFNPITKETTMVVRKKLIVDEELYYNHAYRDFIGSLWIDN